MTELNKKPVRLAGVKGMHDMLPEQAALWTHFEDRVSVTLRAYGYQLIRTPIVEQAALFTRGIGGTTDIVEKEMYCFADALNGEQLALRPENTAAVVRAVIEHNLLYDGPKRLWYSGPMFRHERPQRGRYRQFHQFGVEALGFAGADADAEIILIGQRLWDNLGLQGLRLELNTLGQPHERIAHRAALVDYLGRHIEVLDEEARRRLKTNPLRILDTKSPALQDLVQSAPKLIDFLGERSHAHFEALGQILRANGVSFTVNPRLVRGLDYYNLTVFEWVTDRLGAQGSVAGGGRYDALIEQLGGRPTPACGWALGVERILELLREEGRALREPHCNVYVLYDGEAARLQAFIVSERLRAEGLRVIQHCSSDGASARFKTQMKRADASGAAYAVIIGDDEMAHGTVTIKALRCAGAAQRSVAVEQLTRKLFDGNMDAHRIEE